MSFDVGLRAMLQEKGPEIGLVEEKDREATIGCIINYANPGCGNAICWLAYRIWNAIKAIFGQSDWQVTTSLIQAKVSEKNMRAIAAKPALSAIAGLCKNDLELLAKNAASEALEFMLWGANNSDCSQSEGAAKGEEFEQKLAELAREFGEIVQQKVQANDIQQPTPDAEEAS